MTVTHSIIHAIVQQQKVAKGAKEVYNGDTIIHIIVTRLQPNVEHYNGVFPTYTSPSMEKESRCSCKRITTHGVSCAFPIRYLPFAQKKGSAFKGAR